MEWAQSGTKCEYYGKEGSLVEINAIKVKCD